MTWEKYGRAKQDQQLILAELESELKTLTATASSRRLFMASLAMLLGACSSVPKSRYREGENDGQGAELTPAQERQLTQEALQEMRKDYPLAQDRQLQSYISDLGQKLVMANGLNGNPYTYTFSVVDVAYVNAFALPAGTVFITAPLIEMAGSEAELIGVVGHEVGHIKARHTAERMHQAKKSQGKGWLYALGGGLLGGGLGFGIGKLACPPRDNACLSRAAQLGALAGVGGGLLVQKYAFMANSREDEMEADRIGFRTATKTGYDKDHVGLFYSKLLKMEQESKKSQNQFLGSLADAMSTHPPSKERVDQMNEMARSLVASNPGLVSSANFEPMKARASQIARASRSTPKS